MGADLRARLRAKFSRRNSVAASFSSANSDGAHHSHLHSQLDATSRSSSTYVEEQNRRRPSSSQHDDDHSFSLMEESQPSESEAPMPRSDSLAPMLTAAHDRKIPVSDANGNDRRPSTTNSNLPSINEDDALPASHVSEKPPPSAETAPLASDRADEIDHDQIDPLTRGFGTPTPVAPIPLSPSSPRPTGPPRRQSLLPNRQTVLIKTLLQAAQAHDFDFAGAESLLPISASMVTRKVWVRRPGASATLITVNEDDLVDDVRDMILRKYTNSIGRHFDAPDLTLRISPREQRQDRTLGPEEPVGRTLDAYYPGGQTVDEALLIDIPVRRTPRASPRVGLPHATTIYFTEDGRPSEAGEGYFPPVGAIPSPSLPVPVTAPINGAPAHSIAVLGTGQIPTIPSPGGTRSRAYRERPERPRLGRTHTSSPTILNVGVAPLIAAAANHGTHTFHPRLPPSRTHSNASDQSAMPPAAPPLPTPPAPEAQQVQRVATPPPRVSSPRPSNSRPKKSKKNLEHPNLPPGMLNGGVPPINVLIVEDNPINLKLLEAFVKRLKVRWQTAMNGRDAVHKWRSGGFHLVLMDIQLPVMNGLDATREIRRLERVNSIGVFSSLGNQVPETINGNLEEKDRLSNTEMFKSPVIIVALTASSLQSDRHEALAAGCNDFLTKPVNFVWLERKVMEWGCMQALIDFDGWRKWKDFSQAADESEAAKKPAATKAKAKKNRLSLTTAA